MTQSLSGRRARAMQRIRKHLDWMHNLGVLSPAARVRAEKLVRKLEEDLQKLKGG